MNNSKLMTVTEFLNNNGVIDPGRAIFCHEYGNRYIPFSKFVEKGNHPKLILVKNQFFKSLPMNTDFVYIKVAA